MHTSILALAASLSAVAAVSRGFNYGAVTRTGAIKDKADFATEFNAAQDLAGTDGAFSSARLYTMIQAGTESDPISAIPAAISSNTRLFLGMWASSGPTTIENEISALKAAIKKYGSDFTSRVNGISVGSEDLYRISPTGLKNDPLSIGAQPDEIVDYIRKVRSALKGTALSAVPVGHVDTWDVWHNGSNAAVVAEADFLGMNTFPYFQTTEDNSIDNAPTLFNDAYDITLAAANGKPVIVTETGWPVSGKNSADADPSPKNARSYYKEVGCNTLFWKVDTYWYTLVDANTDTANQPQFGVVGTTVSTAPLFDLSCDASSNSSSSSSASTRLTSSTRTKPGSSTTVVLSAGTLTASAGTEQGLPTATSIPVGTNQTTIGSGSISPTGTQNSPSASFTGAASQMKASIVGAAGFVAALMALV